jgi:hypothetical protein
MNFSATEIPSADNPQPIRWNGALLIWLGIANW